MELMEKILDAWLLCGQEGGVGGRQVVEEGRQLWCFYKFVVWWYRSVD